MKSASAPTVRTAARTILASSIASLLLAGLAHGVTWSGTQLLELGVDPGEDDVDLLGSTVVTLDEAAGTLLENVIFNANPGATTTLTVNNAAGPTRVLAANATVLGAGNGKSLVVAGSADFRIGAVADGGFANMELVKNGGAGELILDNLASDLDGATLLVVDGTMSIFGGGGTTSAVDTLIQPIRIDGAAGKLRLGSLGSVGTTFNNNLAVNESGTLEHTAATHDTLGGIVALAAGRTLNANVTGGSLRLAGSFSRGGNSNLAKNGAGTLFLSGFGSGTGLTNVNAGTLQYSMPGALYGGATASWTAANITAESGATLAVNVGGAGEFTTGNVTTLLAGLSTVSNNGLKAGATFGFDTTNAPGTVSYTGALANSSGAGGGAVGFTKLGTGTLILSGTNTYTGPTNVSGGTLHFTKPGALYNGAAASWTAANITVESGATLAVNVGGAGEFTTGNVTTLLAQISTVANNGLKAGATVGFDTTNAVGAVSYASPITDSTGAGGGAVSVTKLGAGTLTLGGVNTHSGATTVSAGTLALAAGGAIANSSGISVAAGATYDVSAVPGYTLAQSLSAKTAGTANVVGALNAGAQTISLQDGANIGTLALGSTLTLSGATLRFDLSETTSDQITVGGNVTMSGTNIIDVARLAFASGLATGAQAYTLITAGGGLVSGNFSLSNSLITIGSTNYTLTLSGTATHQYLGVATGSVAVPTTYTLATSVSAQSIRLGTGTSTITTTLTNTGTVAANSDSLSYTSLGSTVAPGGGVTLGAPAAGGTLAPNAAGTAQTVANQTFSSSVAGSYLVTASAGTVTNTTVGGSPTLQGGVGTATVNVYRLAAPNAISSPLTFSGNHHVGDVVATQTLSLTNTAAADGFSERLDGAIAASTGGALGSGSVSLLVPGANSTALQVGLDTSEVGALSGTVTVGLTSNGAGTSGLGTLALASQVITVNAGSVFRLAAPSTISGPVTFSGNYHVGDVVPGQTLVVSNDAAADGFSEHLDAAFTGSTGGATGTGTITLLAPETENSTGLIVGLDTSSVGAKSGTVTVGLTSNGAGTSLLGTTALTPQVVTVNAGSVFRLAAPNTISANVNLGRVRVGGAFGTATLSLTNVAAAGAFTEGLNATFASMSGAATHNSGAISNLAGGASDSASLVVGLGGAANTATPGAVSGTVTVGLASNGTASGLADTALPAQVVSVSGFVYSGLGVWNLPGSGTWAAIPNWQANGGVPGLDAGFEATDTATFSSAATGDATVSLQGVSPSLKTVVFDSAAHDYEIDNAGGGGLKLDNGASNATVTNSAGNHLISAPVELRSNASVAVSGAGDVLAITGAVTQSGTRSLTKTGDGTLNLGGNQLYDTLTTTGGVTNIDGVLGAGAGTASVQANATTRFGSVSQNLASLTIGPGATVVFTSGAAGFSGGGKGSSAGGSAVVPEPSALGLLLVGAFGMLTRRRRE
jgi:autotransporter-associated beta strand protein